jgi:hypothetical protein
MEQELDIDAVSHRFFSTLYSEYLKNKIFKSLENSEYEDK